MLKKKALADEEQPTQGRMRNRTISRKNQRQPEDAGQTYPWPYIPDTLPVHSHVLKDENANAFHTEDKTLSRPTIGLYFPPPRITM